MLQLSPVQAAPVLQRLRAAFGRRIGGVALALLVEALLLIVLLSLGSPQVPGAKDRVINVVNVGPDVPREAEAEPSSPEPKQQEAERPAEQRAPADEPLPPEPVDATPAPAAPAIVPPAREPLPPVAALPAPARPRASGRPLYGPPDKGGSSAFRDTERVGTAPNGEPLYAAAWYREPRPEELRAYLSTATGPGWGLIACRTASDYRVEDCVGLSEYPEGSQITRAVLAAAWEFKVRPPRLGGRPLVGSWVRIRIDYGVGRS